MFKNRIFKKILSYQFMYDELFRGHLAALIGDKIRKTCLILFGHVQRMPGMAAVRKTLAMQVDSPQKK